MRAPTRMDEAPDAQLVAAARAGDQGSFRSLTDRYGPELRVHCYRMLGSLPDAEDALQETLVRAWRHLIGFDGRSTLRTWLYTIATNVCLSAATRRRTGEEMLHLTPLPDTYLDELPPSEGPASRYELGESVQLAFLTAIQLLTPRQRAVLILRDVLDFTAKESADMMGVSVASVNSALQRARGTLKQERGHGRLETRSTELSSAAERSLVQRFVEAWQGVDIEGLVAILTDDAVLTMPPFPMRYVGRESIKEFFTRVPAGELDRFRLVTTRANGQPAVAAYLFDPESGTHRAYGIMVLSLDGEAVHEITGFSHPSLFASFGLAMQYDAGD